jgi:hypothetical protein
MIRKVLVSIAILASVTSAHAGYDSNTEHKGWIGGLFGLNIPDLDGTSARAGYGFTAGAKMGSEIGLGGYYITSSKEEDAGNFDYSLYGVEVTYQFEGEASGVYLGGRVGLSSLDSGNFNFNPYHWGALVGYNHFIAPNISLGGEGTFFSVAKDTDTATVGNIAVNNTAKAFHIIAVMATAKFWF